MSHPQVPKGMKAVTTKQAGPLYMAAAVWAVFGLFLPLYRLTHFLLATALSVAAYLVGERFLFPPKTQFVKVEEPLAPSGDADTDRIIAEGRAAIAELRRLNDAIEDAEISRQIDRLEALTTQIFREITADPKKTPRIRKFMNYYLPTTLKLLRSYQKMDGQGATGQNITETLESIRRVLGTVVQAFEKQLDNLFEHDALDISTDITVLEGMLAREGLTQSDFGSDFGKGTS